MAKAADYSKKSKHMKIKDYELDKKRWKAYDTKDTLVVPTSKKACFKIIKMTR